MAQEKGPTNPTRIGSRSTMARTGPEPLEMGGVLIHPGSRIGNYIFIREVGSGGMAKVLLAKEPSGELVALKVLRKNRFKSGLQRFRREFRALSKVNHPNVIHVEAYGDLFGHPYIAMEYVDGLDLHAQIRQFRNWDDKERWNRVEEILIDLCRALAAIHRRGLVHRDLKPSNVLMTEDGQCKLTDFGIVKDLDPSQDPMVSTTLVGTWAYASPEQITGQPIDHRSDLYSLGVILFAMLTGKRPFTASDINGYASQHRDRPAPAPQEIRRSVPDHLDEICRRLLRKAPRDRYQSAQEILYRLEAEDREPTQEESDLWTPPLVGRQLEVEAITNSVSALTRGGGDVMFLEGDDGTGKSRLLDVATIRARNLGVPYHYIEFNESEPGFSGLQQLARALARELGTRSPAELRITDRTDTPSARNDLRHALFDGIREALKLLLEDQPQVVLLDNIHFAPSRFTEFIIGLTGSLFSHERLPLLLIASTRRNGPASVDRILEDIGLKPEPKRIEVGPLGRSDTVRILCDLIPETSSSRLLAQRIHSETEGNALFTVELIRSLVANETLKRLPDGALRLELQPDEIANEHLEIPHGIRQMMRSRLEGTTASDRAALEVLAVGGRELDLDVVLDVLDGNEEAILDGLERLLATSLIRERRSNNIIFYRVTHRKFAEVLYRDLHPDRRARLHRKLAGALELHYSQNPSALEIVGEHYRKAGDTGRAYRYLVAAARRLLDRSLVQEAWNLTERAAAIEESAHSDLEPADFRAFRRDLLSIRANVLSNRAEWAEAEVSFSAVRRLALEDGDTQSATQAAIELTEVLVRQNRFDEAEEMVQGALESSRRLHDRKRVAESLLSMCSLSWALGRVDDVERLAQEGLVVAQGEDLAGQRAELLLAATVAQATKGSLASATTGLVEAEAIFRTLRRKRSRCLALANLAELLSWQGEPVHARQRAHTALQIAKDLDYLAGRVNAQLSMGIASLDLGRYDEATEAVKEALAASLQGHLAAEALAACSTMVLLLLETQQYAEAARVGEQALARAEGPDPERHRILLTALVAEASVTDQVPPSLQEVVGELPSLPIPRRSQVQLALARCAYRAGDMALAQQLASTVLQMAGSRGLRLLALEARSILAKTCAEPESTTHQTVGAELARDFVASLPPMMAASFLERPMLAPFGDELRTMVRTDLAFDDL